MTSVLNVDTIADKAGTGPVGLTKQSAAKVWARYNGSSGAIDGVSGNSLGGSFNVSSVTDVGTGIFEMNTTNAFDSLVNISIQTNSSYSQANTTFYPDNFTTSKLGMRVRNDAGTYYDTNRLMMTTHGDLA